MRWKQTAFTLVIVRNFTWKMLERNRFPREINKIKEIFFLAKYNLPLKITKPKFFTEKRNRFPWKVHNTKIIFLGRKGNLLPWNTQEWNRFPWKIQKKEIIFLWNIFLGKYIENFFPWKIHKTKKVSFGRNKNYFPREIQTKEIIFLSLKFKLPFLWKTCRKSFSFDYIFLGKYTKLK